MSRLLRLDRFLSEAGSGTRSEIKQWAKRGMITVNGSVVKSTDIKVDADADIITLNGVRVSLVEFEYYMLNKPAGVVSATEDHKDKTVLDLIRDHKRKDLFPVGRLDKDTEGLLLITNDGALSHSLLSPKKHVDKTYFAKIAGIVTEDDVAAFRAGLQVDEEFKAMPAELEIVSVDASKETSAIRLTIKEGKFHQVKRMFEAVGKKVTYLKRLQMGSLVLDETLQLGEYRALTEEELQELKR